MRCLDDLLKQVDIVSVAAPTSAHFSATKACLEAGKHVLVEKPIAVTSAEARELVELAARRGCLLQVGHSERFNPIMQRMRPFIERPAFIECHRLSAFGERGTEVDVVLDLMIHDLDLVLSFNPGPVEEVRAAGVPVLSSNIDIANARIALSTADGIHLHYVSIDFQTRQAVVSRRVQAAGAKPTIDIESYQAGDEEPLRLELDSFIHAVNTGTRPVVSGEDGEAALNLATLVLEAIGRFTQRHSADEAAAVAFGRENV